jgi:hypothetical protein
MLDSLLYGAGVLGHHGYRFRGFDLDLGSRDPNGRPRIDIRTRQPLGGAPNLVGLGPIAMCTIAERFLIINLPHAETEIDMVRDLYTHLTTEWGDGWEELASGAEEALARATADMELEMGEAN